MNEGILLVDANGTICYTNPTYIELSCFPSHTVIGQKVDSFFEGIIDFTQTGQSVVCVKRNEKKDIHKWLYIEQIQESNHQTKYTVIQIRNLHTSGFDPLTKLPNRLLLTNQLNLSIKKAQKNRK